MDQDQNIGEVFGQQTIAFDLISIRLLWETRNWMDGELIEFAHQYVSIGAIVLLTNETKHIQFGFAIAAIAICERDDCSPIDETKCICVTAPRWQPIYAMQ